jgi:hypothetical protein
MKVKLKQKMEHCKKEQQTKNAKMCRKRAKRMTRTGRDRGVGERQ